MGFNETPEGGDDFYVVTDERRAKNLVEKRKYMAKLEAEKARTKVVSLDGLFDKIKNEQMKDLNLIVKADVQGSVEAVNQSLLKLTNEEVRVNIVHSGVGAINSSDVMLASASGAIILGFNVRPNPQAKESAEMENVEIRLYRVIYQAIEEIEAAMKGMLDPEFVEEVIGNAEVRQTFKVSGIGTVAGCYVLSGKITRSSSCRLVRDGIVIHEGELSSLKRFKDDVKEALEGYECGITIDKFNDIKEGDILECFEMVEVER
jgi:translation initiation factor IF-2